MTTPAADGTSNAALWEKRGVGNPDLYAGAYRIVLLAIAVVVFIACMAGSQSQTKASMTANQRLINYSPPPHLNRGRAGQAQRNAARYHHLVIYFVNPRGAGAAPRANKNIFA